MKQLLLWLLPLLFTQQLAYCQADTTIDLYIAHDSVLASVQQDSIYRIPIFTDTNINKVIGKYIWPSLSQRTRRQYRHWC